METLKSIKKLLTIIQRAGLIIDQFSESENTLNCNKKVLGAVFPKSKSEVLTLVRIANRYKIHLYPVSTGKNWGLGSSTPVVNNSLIVNMSEMNEISEYDDEMGTVRIEPGVTQQQLADFLRTKKSEFYIDVTGSCPHSSVLGNALERGISYSRQREEAVAEIEAIAGSGEILRTGFGSFSNCKVKNTYEHGLGPGMKGLFFQSNFGIVTSIVFKLPRISKQSRWLALSFADQDLECGIHMIRSWTQRGLVANITHLANKERSFVSLGPRLISELKGRYDEKEIIEFFDKNIPYEWSCLAQVSDHPFAHFIMRWELMKTKFSNLKYNFLSLRKIQWAQKICGWLGLVKHEALLKILVETSQLALGIPSKIATERLGENGNNIDSSRTGFGYILPLAPLRSENAREMVEILRRYRYSKVAITLNVLDSHVLEAVASYEFDKSNAKSSLQFRSEIERINILLADKGYISYRVSIQDMHRVTANHPLQKWFIELKSIFDPNGIISPGRYVLEDKVNGETQRVKAKEKLRSEEPDC